MKCQVEYHYTDLSGQKELFHDIITLESTATMIGNLALKSYRAITIGPDTFSFIETYLTAGGYHVDRCHTLTIEKYLEDSVESIML